MKPPLVREETITYLLVEVLDGGILLVGLLLEGLQETVLLIQHLGEPLYFLRGVVHLVLQQLHLGGYGCVSF